MSKPLHSTATNGKCSLEQQRLEIENNEAVARLYGLEDEVPSDVLFERVSLTNNSAFRWPNKTLEERDALFAQSAIVDLISYAVGCMFGRYSLDEPGIILGDQVHPERLPRQGAAPDVHAGQRQRHPDRRRRLVR